MIPIISIVGKSGSGKTTLLEKIIPELKKRGYKVGTVKHDAHQFEIDYPGKDSYRHFQAGSDTVVICSPEKLALVKRMSRPLSLDELVEELFEDMDIVITEGYRAEDKPKIEVCRSGAADESPDAIRDDRIALVSDRRLEIDIPQFDKDDVDGIVGFIEEQMTGDRGQIRQKAKDRGQGTEKNMTSLKCCLCL